MSSTGSGSDQPHLLALLRAIRLRSAAPDAAEAGAADTHAALTEIDFSHETGAYPHEDPHAEYPEDPYSYDSHGPHSADPHFPGQQSHGPHPRDPHSHAPHSASPEQHAAGHGPNFFGTGTAGASPQSRGSGEALHADWLVHPHWPEAASPATELPAGPTRPALPSPAEQAQLPADPAPLPAAHPMHDVTGRGVPREQHERAIPHRDAGGRIVPGDVTGRTGPGESAEHGYPLHGSVGPYSPGPHLPSRFLGPDSSPGGDPAVPDPGPASTGGYDTYTPSSPPPRGPGGYGPAASGSGNYRLGGSGPFVPPPGDDDLIPFPELPANSPDPAGSDNGPPGGPGRSIPGVWRETSQPGTRPGPNTAPNGGGPTGPAGRPAPPGAPQLPGAPHLPAVGAGPGRPGPWNGDPAAGGPAGTPARGQLPAPPGASPSLPAGAGGQSAAAARPGAAGPGPQTPGGYAPAPQGPGSRTPGGYGPVVPTPGAQVPGPGPAPSGFTRLTAFPAAPLPGTAPVDPAPLTPRGPVTPAIPPSEGPPGRPLPAVPPRADVQPFPAAVRDAQQARRPMPGYGAGGLAGIPRLAGISPVEGVGPIPGGPVIPYVGNPMPGDPVLPLGVTPPPVRVNVASVPGAVQPGDGMDPADDAALHETQRLLSNSLSLAGGPQEVAVRLRSALLQAQPQLLAALPGSPLVQREQLAAALTWLVHNLDDPPRAAAGCAQLGAALAECGVQPQQFQLVGAALAEAMRAGMSGGLLRQDFDAAWRNTWQHANEWIVQGGETIGYQPTLWTAVVVSHDMRRHDLAVVRMRPYLPMPFRPGQYARIEVPQLPGIWRPYSLAGAPRRDNVVELHVRAKTTSGVSGTLVYETQVGDKVRFARAEGLMGLPGHPARDLLLIAGDTGVAPLKALLTELAATGDPRSAVLFWGARNLDELYDIDEITEIARACKRATVVPVISEGNPGPYASGLVTDAVAAYGEWSQAEAFLAGPPVMLAATSAALQLLGVDPARIHHDLPEG